MSFITYPVPAGLIANLGVLKALEYYLISSAIKFIALAIVISIAILTLYIMQGIYLRLSDVKYTKNRINLKYTSKGKRHV